MTSIDNLKRKVLGWAKRFAAARQAQKIMQWGLF
jgi:hypothetical protein